jgi:hypothetical protein
MIIYEAHITGGKHIVFIPKPVIESTLKIGFWTFLIAPIANVFVKLSLTMMMLKIKRHSRTWRWFLWPLIAILVIVIPGSTLPTILSCNPVNAFWHISELASNCWPTKNTVYFSYAFGAFFVFTDFIMAMLP